jgi:ribosomal-protein-alanine N-acetyltransferase
MTVEFIRALGDPVAAGHMIGAAIPDGWPDAELAGLLPLYVGWVDEDPTVLGFGPWTVIDRGGRVVVGSAGFVGPPTPTGSIEIGFGIDPDHRRRGYASEAAEALLGWALDQPKVRRVIATCERDNHPSVRVLEKVGMSRTSSDEGVIRWEIAKVNPSGRPIRSGAPTPSH